MKKALFIFTLIFSLSSIKTIHASHINGGEITWRCLGNGQYQFYLDLYRSCSGATFNYINQTINVSRAPISTITVKPDFNRRAIMHGGNISPVGIGGMQQVCSQTSSMPEVYEVYYFISDPLTLNGIPPSNGWEFSWSLCCLHNCENLMNTNFVYIKSIMYPYNNQNTDPCFDNSPRFVHYPTTAIQLGAKYTLRNNVADNELDSLVFEFDDVPTSLNSLATWKNGYNKSSPFPGTIQDSSNINVKMDSKSGHINGLIHSPDSFSTYAYAVRIDSYRDTTKIASVWRSMVVHTIPKDTLNTGIENDLPFFVFDGIPTDTYTIDVNVGDTVLVDIQVKDTNKVYADPNDTTTLRSQNIKMTASGFMFANDFQNNNNCAIPGIDPCATMNPALNINIMTGQYELNAQDSINTTFTWQPQCKHLNVQLKDNQRIHSFVFSAVDDNFPPRESFAVLNIIINKLEPVLDVVGNQITVTSPSNYYQWFYNDTLIPNSDTNTILMQNTGTYTVQLGIGCPYKEGSYYYNPVALKENSLSQNISIFPNPSNELFTIAIGNLEHSKLELKMMDMSGKEIQVKIHSSQNHVKINASSLKSGIYFLNISSEGEQANFKLLKL